MMLTATPMVASAIAAGAAALACAQLVVSPPSARISTRALSPRTSASAALSNLTPIPALAEHQANPEEDEQRGQPGAVREPCRHDRGEHGDSADEEVEPKRPRCHRVSTTVARRP